MIKLTDILKELKVNNPNPANIADFCNIHFRKLEEIFGKIGSEFELSTLSDGMIEIEIASAGVDENNGIDISFNPKYEEYSNDYNEIEDYDVAGKTIYVNDYLDHRENEDD
jgi:hypothetical protein